MTKMIDSRVLVSIANMLSWSFIVQSLVKSGQVGLLIDKNLGSSKFLLKYLNVSNFWVRLGMVWPGSIFGQVGMALNHANLDQIGWMFMAFSIHLQK